MALLWKEIDYKSANIDGTAKLKHGIDSYLLSETTLVIILIKIKHSCFLFVLKVICILLKNGFLVKL